MDDSKINQSSNPDLATPEGTAPPMSEAGKSFDHAVQSKTEEIARREVAYWVFREIERSFPTRFTDCVLDVGGGTGAYLSLLKSRLSVKKFISTDMQPRTGYADPDLVYLQVGAEELTKRVSPGSVDLVLMIEVLEHLVNPDVGIEEVFKCLKPGGVLILTTPNLSSLLNRMALLFGYLPLSAEVSARHVFGRPGEVVAGHLRLHTFRSLVEFLSYYDFIIRSAYTVHNSRSMYSSAGRVGTLLYWVDRFSALGGSQLGSRNVVVAYRR
jgi:SAM-dependent methyltransferase